MIIYKFSIKIGSYKMKSDKTNKKSQRLQLQEETKEIRISYFIRKKNERQSNSNFQNNW